MTAYGRAPPSNIKPTKLELAVARRYWDVEYTGITEPTEQELTRFVQNLEMVELLRRMTLRPDGEYYTVEEITNLPVEEMFDPERVQYLLPKKRRSAARKAEQVSVVFKELDPATGEVLATEMSNVSVNTSASQPVPKKRRPRVPDPSFKREATRLLGVHVPESVYRDFRMLAAKNGTTTDAMLAQALELLFQHHREKVPTLLRQKLQAKGL